MECIVGDDCQNDLECFPNEFILWDADVKGTCKECKNRIKDKEHICITDDYVLKYKTINFDTFRGFSQQYNYNGHLLNIPEAEYSFQYILEKRMENIDSVAKLFHYSTRNRKIKVRRRRSTKKPDEFVDGMRQVFVYENLNKSGFQELAKHPLRNKLHIYQYCESIKPDEELLYVIDNFTHSEVVKPLAQIKPIAGKYTYMLKNYKSLLETWYNKNKILLEPIFRAAKEIIDCGVYHRDVFEDNIFIDKNLNIKFIDFEYSEESDDKIPYYYAFKHFIRAPLDGPQDNYVERFLDTTWSRSGIEDGVTINYNIYSMVRGWLNYNKNKDIDIDRKTFRRIMTMLCKIKHIHKYYIDFICRKFVETIST